MQPEFKSLKPQEEDPNLNHSSGGTREGLELRLYQGMADILPGLLKDIDSEHFGETVTVSGLGQGSTNLTFLVVAQSTTGEPSEFVVKANFGEDRGAFQHVGVLWSQFHKEQYWGERLRKEVPELKNVVPRIFGVHYIETSKLPPVLAGHAVKPEICICIQEKVGGRSLGDISSDEREGFTRQLMKQLSKCAAKINEISPTGSGIRFDVEAERFYRNSLGEQISSMKERIDWQIQTARHCAKDLLTAEQCSKLSQYIDAYAQQDLKPTLVYGDLNEGSGLLGEDGQIVGLVDAETIRSGPGRLDEIADRYHHLEPIDFFNFMAGYAEEMGEDPESFRSKMVEAIHGRDLVMKLIAVEGATGTEEIGKATREVVNYLKVFNGE